MVRRIVKPSISRSFFLFGARGSGKSTFINSDFLISKKVYKIDLLDLDQEEKYIKHPMALYEEIKTNLKKWDWIFIDEVQKCPKLLDVVHKSIEDLKAKFILTGSSARKLKRGGANLLAGRAFLYSLYPLTSVELGKLFDLTSALQWGTLPSLLQLPDNSDKKSYLKSYCQIYLKEEIKSEQLVRNIDPFRNFLEISAQMSGKIINNTKIGNDIGVDHKTVQNYFEILCDTWLGFFVPAFHQSVRKSQKLSPKFYYFDLGVKNQLSQTIDSLPTQGTSTYGELFEHFVINEIYRLNEYWQKDFILSYLKTKNDAEIDLILSKGRYHFAIEIKSSKYIDTKEVKKLKALAEDIKNIKKVFYISNCKDKRTIDDVQCLHWQDFISDFQKL